eukprot:scaffold2802_cov105-Pinguiococcus_pyrenoidosus.AAC.1
MTRKRKSPLPPSIRRSRSTFLTRVQRRWLGRSGSSSRARRRRSPLTTMRRKKKRTPRHWCRRM